jgi:thiol-disulfide isomerase/thioredoxin
MSLGTILTILSLAATVACIASYWSKMKNNQTPLRPRFEQSLMCAALPLALAPGVAGYVLGGLSTIPAALFLLATATSGLPNQTLAATVGAIAPDFVATDADGREFNLSEQTGSPVLLKFYRGYWCPYCVAELTQFDRVVKEFASLGVKLERIAALNWRVILSARVTARLLLFSVVAMAAARIL